MAKTGPKPKCVCGNCELCIRRATAMRAYWRSRGHDIPLRTTGRFAPSKLQLPQDVAVRAYIAGIVDGEGCITMANKCWRLQVAMTDEPIIRWLGTFGGTVRERSVKGNRLPCWRWLIQRQAEVEEILLALMPYLRVKRLAAEAASSEIAARRQAAALVRMA